MKKKKSPLLGSRIRNVKKKVMIEAIKVKSEELTESNKKLLSMRVPGRD